jgi:hypothetical protein
MKYGDFVDWIRIHCNFAEPKLGIPLQKTKYHTGADELRNYTLCPKCRYHYWQWLGTIDSPQI